MSEVSLPEMSVAEALAILDSEPVEPTLNTQCIDPYDWHGHRLVGSVVADRDQPAFDKALMDGFAVRAADVPATLAVVQEISAGNTAPLLKPRTAAPIMTGAPLPAGADAVVPIERCTVIGDMVELPAASAGQSVALRGSDRPEGAKLLHPGVHLFAAAYAVLATIGVTEAPLHTLPSAAVITTGDELVQPDQVPLPHQIRNATEPMLLALLPWFADVRAIRRNVPDTFAEVHETLRLVLDDAQCIFIAGGMSMGTHDYVPDVLRELGFEFRIHKLRIRPGKPFVFAVLPKDKSPDGRPRYAFGLPGNPVSAFVCTLRLASRLLIRLGGGDPAREMPLLPMPLAGPLEKANGPREFYQPCRLDEAGVHPLAWRGSADVFTLAQADALLVRPEKDPPHAAGELVKVLPIPR